MFFELELHVVETGDSFWHWDEVIVMRLLIFGKSRVVFLGDPNRPSMSLFRSSLSREPVASLRFL
jgi:hypothetical protein